MLIWPVVSVRERMRANTKTPVAIGSINVWKALLAAAVQVLQPVPVWCACQPIGDGYIRHMTANATALRNRLISRARLRNILVFVKTAELGSVRLAAEAAGMAQPSASQSLAELESLLQAPLFLRHSRGMSLTAAGRALLPLARRLLDAVDEGAHRVAALQGSSSGMVRIAAITAAVHGFLMEALPHFSRDNPDIVLHLEEMEGKRQLALIADAEIDICLCRHPGTLPEGWRFEPLVADRFTIVCHPGHPLCTGRPVPLDELASEIWLTVPVSMAARRALDRLFEEAPQFPRLHSVVTTVPALITELLRTERLLALMPMRLVQRAIADGRLAEVPLPIDLPLLDIGMLRPEADENFALQKLSAFLSRRSIV
jgi:DNA-binding transcriptional LysR family regulator